MKEFMTCKDCIDLFLDYLEGELDPDVQRRLDEHFSECPPCVNFLEDYRSFPQLAAKLRDQEAQVPKEIENRLCSFLKENLDI